MNCYPATYLEKHEVYESSLFSDREEAMECARDLRRKGWRAKTRRVCPFGTYYWIVEGVKDK